MEGIGGYFGLEKINEFKPFFESESAFYLNSGRHSLEFIIRGIKNIKKIFIPSYTCEVVLEPVLKLGISFEFYRINNELEIDANFLEKISNDEYIIINNYFGLKDDYLEKVSTRFKNLLPQIIIDASQSLYFKNSSFNYVFYSFPKFVGVPDGGVAVIKKDIQFYQTLFETLDVSISYDNFSHLLKRIDIGSEEGYEDFKKSMNRASYAPLQKISGLTKMLVDQINYDEIRKKRRDNFDFLNASLKELNLIHFDLGRNNVPLNYPFLIRDGRGLKNHLLENKIYLPTYWESVNNRIEAGSAEETFVNDVAFIPVDQRLGEIEMNYIIKKIENYVR